MAAPARSSRLDKASREEIYLFYELTTVVWCVRCLGWLVVGGPRLVHWWRKAGVSKGMNRAAERKQDGRKEKWWGLIESVKDGFIDRNPERQLNRER